MKKSENDDFLGLKLFIISDGNVVVKHNNNNIYIYKLYREVYMLCTFENTFETKMYLVVGISLQRFIACKLNQN